ncbi:MAG: DUF2497 domain-containing protein [Proteobacteria bacterium]|nr:DUF2497 domain-containing protein [Pseudomonadota bacterium]
MTQPAKAREPSMEEILASIRRIIADDDAGKPVAPPPGPAAAPEVAAPAKPAAKAPEPAAAKPAPAKPAAPPAADAAGMGQDDIDALLADLNATPPSEEKPPPDDILDLTESMAAPPPPPAAPVAGFRTIEAEPDVAFKEAAPEPRAAVALAVDSRGEAGNGALLSRSTVAAVDSAFNSLAHTVLVQNARTLEDLVREMLRPLLKSWLDDNLPGVVERLVRAEIERVSRGTK